jgi:hypothetical protein
MSQIERIRNLSMSVLLAGNVQLAKLARWLPQQTHQDSRIQWLRRLLDARYLDAEWSYQPLIRAVMAQMQGTPFHLIMDRSVLQATQFDLLSLNLYFRGRALPMVWDIIPHGSSNFTQQKSLIARSQVILPPCAPIVFHGDNEFGSIPLIHHLRQFKWDILTGQAAGTYYRRGANNPWQLLKTLPITRTQPIYCPAIELSKTHQYGPLNLFGFYQPRFAKQGRRRDIAYYVTTLPITPKLRPIGRHRWGVECFYKDYKSSGWQIQLSALTHLHRLNRLLSVLSIVYLWMTCMGRWLCKTSQRNLVDSKAKRHLSLFRLGWDWIVHQYRTDALCPALLTLYQ